MNNTDLPILLFTLCTLLGEAWCFHVALPRSFSHIGMSPHFTRQTSTTTKLSLNLNSNDPFEVLDISPDPSLDKKQIKRAYKRLALKYHPDVVTNASSSKEEKKKASDNFAKINWAYETLIGKNGAQASTASSGKTSSSRSGYGYQPPHRRTGAYASNPNASTDWKDYMPKYDDDDYDAGGDSFEKIFSDLFAGAAGAAASGAVGGGGVFRDFVEFLERNVDGYSASSTDDAELILLLRSGSLEEVGNEMDDTELVVQQLSSKLKNIEDELVMVKADLKVSTRYMEKLDFEERIAELEARQKVVQGYIKKARKRLVSLQTRYKELIVGGESDGRTRSQSTSSYSSSSYGSNYGSTQRSSNSGSSTRTSSSSKTDGDDEAWKRQGFGSAGRRGSSRRRRGRGTVEENAPPRSAQPPPNPGRQTSQRGSAFSSNSTGESWSVPPHRRPSGQTMDDKRRMREMKVDEEFDKLKKDLGL